MSLLKWSTPERRMGDRILPVVPNEIYLHILDLIPPVTGRPLPEELDTLTSLSLVCRFFANICLPRIFEHVEFSCAVFRDSGPLSATSRASRASVLCDQISAKEPLALSLVQCVKVCYFTDRKLDDAGSWAVRIFVRKYLTGLTHMKNIRRLEFSRSFVDVEDWRAIATLQSLEELSFDDCNFLRGPADFTPEKRNKVKVSHLQVTDCLGDEHPAAAVDARILSSITADLDFFKLVHWVPQSVVKTIHFRVGKAGVPRAGYLSRVLRKVPPSVEVLSLPAMALDVMSNQLFGKSMWKNWPVLRSLTLRFQPYNPSIATIDIISDVLGAMQPFASINSLTITEDGMARNISVFELQDILCKKLGSTSSLKYVDISGVVLRLVEGEWTKVRCDSM